MSLKFLAQKAVFYSLLFLEAEKRDSTLNLDESKIIEQVCEIFCLTDEEKKVVKALCKSSELAELYSTLATQMHLNALNTICKNKGLFGDKQDEKIAVRCKHQALTLIEPLEESCCGDFIYELDVKKEKDSVCLCALGMIFYLKQTPLTEKDLAFLRRTATNREYCDIDAIMVLLTVDPANKNQYLNLLKQKNCLVMRKDQLNQIMMRFEGDHKEAV